MIKPGDTITSNGQSGVTLDPTVIMDPRLPDAAIRIYAALPIIRPPVSRQKLQAYCQAILDEPGDFDHALGLLIGFDYLVVSDD